MKITNITPMPIGLRSANGPMTFFVVRIETDNGLVGYGESCDCFGVSYPQVHAAIVMNAFGPRLVGQELTAVAPLIAQLRRATRREMGESWAAAQARSALEIALWDLTGQHQQRSISSILGRVRDSIPVYAGSSPFLDDHSADFHLERLRPMLDRGVRHVKLRTGSRPDAAVDVLGDLRRLLGRDIEMMVDASESLDLPTTARLGDRMAELDIRWLEEPLLQSRHGAIARAAVRSRVPIAAGEHLFSTEEALAALMAGEISVIQPDPCISGGIEEAREIARLAAGFGVRSVLHYHAGLIGMAAVLQVAASSPEVDLLEYPVHLDTVLRIQSGTSQFTIDTIVDGRLELPDAPGLGVTPVAAVLEDSLLG